MISIHIAIGKSFHKEIHKNTETVIDANDIVLEVNAERT
jgi:hypothetical protein